MTQSTESNILKIRNESIKIKRWYNFDIEIQSCYFSWKIKDIYSKTTIFRSNEKETNPRQILQISIKFFFYSTSLLSKLWSLFCNEDARSCTPLKTRSFFSFSTLLQEGGETCLAETGTFHRWYKWRVFWSYYSVASGSGPISGKRSVSGGVSSSMRRLQLRHGKLRGRRKGGKKKGKGQKGERERGNWIRIDEKVTKSGR